MQGRYDGVGRIAIQPARPEIGQYVLGKSMAERVSAILNYNRLIVNYFLFLPLYNPHFTPQKFLSIMACNGHRNFISSVTDAVWQSALGLVRHREHAELFSSLSKLTPTTHCPH